MASALIVPNINPPLRIVIFEEFGMQTKRSIIYILLLSLGLSACKNNNSTPGPDYKELRQTMSEIISNEITKYKNAGISIAVVDDQRVVWSEGFGMADSDNNIAATGETLYPVASVTKVFTATAIMQLVEQSLLDIDSSYITYMPEFSMNTRFGSLEDITFRNMLTHHSGLPSDMLHYDTLPAGMLPDSASYLADLRKDYQAFPPNVVKSYSNVAYALLGMAVTKISHRSYPEYLKHALLDPMNMHASYVTHKVGDTNTAIGHTQGKIVEGYLNRTIGDGGLVSSAIDLSQFIKALNNGGDVDGEQVLSEESIRAMFTVQNASIPLDLGDEIGLGWEIVPDVFDDNSLVVRHGGYVPGFVSLLVYSPTAKLGVVVLSNEGTTDLSELAKKAMQLAYKEKYKQSVNISPSTPEALPGIYSDDLFGLYYSKSAGPILVDHDGVNYTLNTLENDYVLIRSDEGKYAISSEIPDDALNGLVLTLTDLQGYQVFIAETYEEEYARFLFAQKLPDFDLPEAWTHRVGNYNIADDHDRKVLQSDTQPLAVEGGVLMLGEGIPFILVPIDNDHAYIAGLGRGLGGTISYREEQGQSILSFSGIDFVKE
jgi:CubicO group peptidase (beta-lactamase class C family)